MIRLLPIWLAAALLTPIAHAQDVTGDWTGKYICGQGITALHLTIQKVSAGKMIAATFSFGPLPENPDVPAEQITGLFHPLGLTPSEIDDLTEFLANGLYDPNLKRYAPSQVMSGNCFPNNDMPSRLDMGCN